MQEKNEIIEVGLELIDVIDGVSVPKEYKKIPITDLSSLGIAGDSIAKLINTLKLPGGEGIYKVTFPKGFTGSLSQFKSEKAFMGSIISDGKMGQARLTQILFDPTQLFMAFALMGIQQKLKKIEMLQHEILDFMYAKEKSKLTGYFSTLNDLIEDYEFNCNNERFISQALNKVEDIKAESQISEDLYLGQINKTMASLGPLHLYADTNQAINTKLRDNLHNYHIACYLNAYATYFDLILRDNFDDENLEVVKQRIRKKTEQYKRVYTKCERWISDKLGSAVDRVISPVFKNTNNFYAKLLKDAPLNISKIYSNEKYLSIEEQLKRIKQDSECGTSVFVESIDQIQLLNNNSISLYLDSDNAYVLDCEER